MEHSALIQGRVGGDITEDDAVSEVAQTWLPEGGVKEDSGLESCPDILSGPVGGVHVALHDAHVGEYPGAAGGQDLVVGHAHPLDNLCSFGSIRLSSEFIIGHIIGNGNGVGQNTTRFLKIWGNFFRNSGVLLVSSAAMRAF